MGCVVYQISFEGYDKFYIGSAIDFQKRKMHHLSQLRKNNHRNKHLQRVYDKYGESNLYFTILEETENVDLLLKLEQKWIDTYDFFELINICPNAGNTYGRLHTTEAKNKISINHHDVSGENNPMFGKRGELAPRFGTKLSQETKDKISESNKGKKSWCEGQKRPEHSEKMKGEGNPFFDKNHNQETKQKISDATKARLLSKGGKKLTFEVVREIRRRYTHGDVTITQLAKEYGISRHYCGQLIKGVYWNE